MIPYARQSIDEDDIRAVVEVLRSDWLTTGPKVAEFEAALARSAGTAHAVVVSSGTAALHSAMGALEMGPGDEAIVPAITFAASANCVVYRGGTPIFADVQPDTLLIDPQDVVSKITDRTRAIVAVDYAGQPCDYDALEGLCRRHGIKLVADACHAQGGSYHRRPVGSLADLSTFSFHPVKHIATGEGGAITTDDDELARRLRVFRNHGITSDFRDRAEKGSWFYEMVELGFNYRLTDIQCALGISQLKKLPRWIARRQEIARRYDEAFSDVPFVEPLTRHNDREHAYHLYVIRLDASIDRAAAFSFLRERGIGVNVHYIPVHLHPFYRQTLGTGPGICPVAEQAYERIVSIPMFPGMSDEEVEEVIGAVTNIRDF